MASRAHVIHDYSFARQAPTRQRRAVWLHSDEEVVLPRSRTRSGAGALLISALVASALTAGLAYAVYMSEAPSLSATEAAPLDRAWEVDPSLTRASLTNQLSGPAFAVPSREGAMTVPEDGWADVPLNSSAASASPSDSGSSRETSFDSSPAMQPAPIQQDPALSDLPASNELAPPYPNPTTTPPEGFAPSSAPQEIAPPRDPENPY